MYHYPFLLFTEDDVHNNKISDMFEDELSDILSRKQELYNSLPSDMHHKKVLYDLLEIEKILTLILIDVFRSNINVLGKELPDIDQWRIKEQLKRTLTQMRRKSTDFIHPYEDYTFLDIVRKIDLWEDNKVFQIRKPFEWNNVFLSRMSDIHHNLERLITILEPKLLVMGQILSPVISTIPPTTTISDGQDTEVVKSISKLLEALRLVHREVKDYIRLIDSI